MNWQNDASGPYDQVAARTVSIGEQTAQLIQKLGLNPSTSVHCVGHSLGKLLFNKLHKLLQLAVFC